MRASAGRRCGTDVLSSLLPLWEKVARTKSTPDEGFASAERDPSPALVSLGHPLPQGERERSAQATAIRTESDTAMAASASRYEKASRWKIVIPNSIFVGTRQAFLKYDL